jgi:hypothetical protein
VVVLALPAASSSLVGICVSPDGGAGGVCTAVCGSG